MHSFAYNYASPSFDNTWQRNVERNVGHDLRNQDFFILPPVRIKSFRKFPIYSIPHKWNTLNDSLRYQHNRATFKIALTDHLLGTLIDT